MSKKHFGTETKIKYINMIKKHGFDYALISFICEFEERYLEYQNYQGTKRKYRLPTTLGRMRLNSWINKYNVGGMKNLESEVGKAKKPNAGRRTRVSINELNEHDRDYYQEIVEELLRDKGVTPREIQERLKNKNKEKNKGFQNHMKACEIFCINRTTFYKKYVKKEKIKIYPIKRLKVDGFIEFMCLKIIKSDYTIGKEKLYKLYKKQCLKSVSSYVFRIHFEAMSYKSRAYVRNKSNKPREDKYKAKWVEDHVKGNFKSDYPGEVLHADIKYLFFDNSWWYLHVMIETYSNSIVAWSLAKNRTAMMTISLFEQAVLKTGVSPRVFHSDYGVEYANYIFKNHLESKGTIQSMSVKGSPLLNRPSEYWFALIQHEKLEFYDYKNWNYDQVYNMIDKYIGWYNNGRPQSNLNYKTPQMVWTNYGVCV